MGEKPIAVDGLTAPVQKIVRSQAPLSGIVLRAFYEGTEAVRVSEKVAAIEGSQLAHLFKTFPVTDFQTFKTAIREYKDLCKINKAVPKVAKVRASEVQSLFGAFRWCEYRPEKAGYHAAVAAAREALRVKELKWDGGRIAQKWEKTIKAEVLSDAEVELATRMDMKRAEMDGQEVTEEMVAKIREKHFAAAQSAEMRTLAASLVKKYGTEKCEQLVEHLTATIATAQQQSLDAAAQKIAA